MLVPKLTSVAPSLASLNNCLTWSSSELVKLVWSFTQTRPEGGIMLWWILSKTVLVPGTVIGFEPSAKVTLAVPSKATEADVKPSEIVLLAFLRLSTTFCFSSAVILVLSLTNTGLGILMMVWAGVKVAVW